MPASKSYIASIVVNGQKLIEYDPPEDEPTDDPRKCVKYVEVSEGSEFRVHLDLTPQTKFSTPNKIVRVFIDGNKAAGSVITKNRFYQSPHNEYKSRIFQENGTLVKQAFMFKKMVTTDETPRMDELKQIAKDIGSITIKVYRATAGELIPMSAKLTESSDVIPEKALKGQPIDIAAGYGEKKASKHRYADNSETLGRAEAFFEFKYRSRRALQLLGLIPTTPEPQALEERDINTLNPDEMRMLLSQYRQRDSPAPTVKPEGMKIEKLEGEGTETRDKKRRIPFIDDDELQIVDVKRCKPRATDGVDVCDLT